MNRQPDVQDGRGWLTRWLFFHSLFMIFSTLYSFVQKDFNLVIMAGGGSFIILLLFASRYLRIGNIFHLANLITLTRLGGIFALSIFGQLASYPVIIGSGLTLLLVDCLDGWAARYFNRRSEFGEFFDKETDAFYLLLVCLLTVKKGLFPSWIVLLGLARYLFVISVFSFKSKVAKEKKSERARFIFTVVMIILLAAFLPFNSIRIHLSLLASLLLLMSFSIDMQRVFKPLTVFIKD